MSGEPTLQRATGTLRLTVRRRGELTVLDDLRQQGCLKARLPRPELGAWTSAVTLNTSGGIAGGDALDSTVSVGPGARLTVAAQAAERFYRALPGTPPARVRTSLSVGAGAALEWLPQHGILFDRCALDRRLEIDLAPDAWFLGIETLVFGRAAMGEQVRDLHLRDTIRLRRDGRLILHDAIRLQGHAQQRLQRAAIGRGAAAVATLLHAGPDPAAPVEAVRAVLADSDAGVSAWDGILVARILAPDSAALRRAVIAAMEVLRDGRPLPRVWLC